MKATRNRFCEIYPDKAKQRRADPIAFDVDYQTWRRIREEAEFRRLNAIMRLSKLEGGR